MNTVVPVNRVYSRCKSQVFIESRNREQEACSIGKMAFKRTVQVAGAPECHYRQVHCKLPLQVSEVLGPFTTAALGCTVRYVHKYFEHNDSWALSILFNV